MANSRSKFRTVACLFGALCLGVAVTLSSAAATVGSQLTRVGQLAAAARPQGVPADYVITPNGYFSPTCVATVHKGDQLQASGMIKRASGAMEKPAVCTQDNFTLQGIRVSPNGKRSTAPVRKPEQTGWVETGNYSSDTPINRIVASWTVPAQPANKGEQTIYFFPGLEQLPDVQSILQPVLGWNGYGDKAWTLASWNCCVDGTTFHSDPVSASAGDEVVGDTYSTCGAGVSCGIWNIDSKNVTTGETSSLSTSPYADLNWVFGGVLEVYSVASCNQYPGGPIAFHNIQVYDRNNNRVANPPWGGSDTSGIDPQCNYGQDFTPTSVTLSY